MQLRIVPLYLQPNEEKTMLIIPVKEGESIDKALKKFKKKFERTGGYDAPIAQAPELHQA